MKIEKNNLKVLLVKSGITFFDDSLETSLNLQYLSPPLGLAYIAGYVRNKGYTNIRIYDLLLSNNQEAIKNGGKYYGKSDEEIIDILNEFDPHVVGISCSYTRFVFDVHYLAKLIKNFNKDILIIVGGSHASVFYKMVLQDLNIDIAVNGEGEETFFQLLEMYRLGKSFFDVEGCSLRKGNEVIKNNTRPPIADIDNIPFPARDLLEMETIISHSNNPYIMRKRSTSMISSRGCPQMCIYCTIKSVWGKTWRGRSPNSVVDEIQYLHEVYNIGEIEFLDDNIGADKKRLNEICNEIIVRKLDIKFRTPNGIAHWRLDKETLKKMQAAGFYRLTFGIESANKETRTFIRKTHNLDQATELVEYANKIGIWISSTNIIGFPYETRDQIEETIKYQEKSGFDFSAFYVLSPNPASDVYEYFKKEGLLNIDAGLNFSESSIESLRELNKSLNFEDGVDTLHLTKAELQKILIEANQRFFKSRLIRNIRRPDIIIRKIHNIEDFLFVSKIILIFITLLFKVIRKKGRFTQLLWSNT